MDAVGDSLTIDQFVEWCEWFKLEQEEIDRIKKQGGTPEPRGRHLR